MAESSEGKRDGYQNILNVMEVSGLQRYKKYREGDWGVVPTGGEGMSSDTRKAGGGVPYTNVGQNYTKNNVMVRCC